MIGVAVFRIKVRDELGKWHLYGEWDDEDKDAVLDAYNSAPTPRLLTGRLPSGRGGVIHKQYSDNGFIYRGPRA